MNNHKLELSIDQYSRNEVKFVEYEILRRMRIFKKINQTEAGKVICVSTRTMQRFENGHQVFSKERRRKLLQKYRYSVKELTNFMLGNTELPKLSPQSIWWGKARDPKTYRKYKKNIGKPQRVLRILRNQSGLSQEEAGEKCGFTRSYIEHIENGRNELNREKISHIVKSLGFTLHDFDLLLSQPILRDDLLIECTTLLKRIDDEKLVAVKALLENFA